MAQRFAALPRSIHRNVQPGRHLALAYHVANPLRAEIAFVVGAVAAALLQDRFAGQASS
jgi:hypothetical protein